MERQLSILWIFSDVSSADKMAPRWRRRRDATVVASTLSRLSVVLAALALVAVALLPAADALPGSRTYYSAYRFRGDEDRLAPLHQLLPSFADPMPSQLYYGSTASHRLAGIGGGGRPFGRRADAPPRKRQQQQFVPLGEGGVASVERRDGSERLIGKKYDRNCFFSPVQCMLSFNKSPNDEVMWNSRK